MSPKQAGAQWQALLWAELLVAGRRMRWASMTETLVAQEKVCEWWTSHPRRRNVSSVAIAEVGWRLTTATRVGEPSSMSF